MTLLEQYAHDYRDMAMTEEEMRKMLEEFADEIRKERVTHCDDINCPECNKVAYEEGVKAERERIINLIDGWANETKGYVVRKDALAGIITNLTRRRLRDFELEYKPHTL